MRAHPLVRQAMEIFDATSIRVRARAVPQPDSAVDDAVPDDGVPGALIEAPPAAEADR